MVVWGFNCDYAAIKRRAVYWEDVRIVYLDSDIV